MGAGDPQEGLPGAAIFPASSQDSLLPVDRTVDWDTSWHPPCQVRPGSLCCGGPWTVKGLQVSSSPCDVGCEGSVLGAPELQASPVPAPVLALEPGHLERCREGAPPRAGACALLRLQRTGAPSTRSHLSHSSRAAPGARSRRHRGVSHAGLVAELLLLKLVRCPRPFHFPVSSLEQEPERWWKYNRNKQNPKSDKQTRWRRGRTPSLRVCSYGLKELCLSGLNVDLSPI